MTVSLKVSSSEVARQVLVVVVVFGLLVFISFECAREIQENPPIVYQDQEEQMAKKSESTFWVPGQKYFVRTVTMYLTGELVSIEGPNESELVFKNAAWIACTKRFADSIAKGEFEEIEPYPEDMQVVLNRTAVIDACKWEHDLPRTQK